MSATITVDREVIACLVDWIKGGGELDHWLQYGAEEAGDDPCMLKTLELAQQVDQILETRSWEGQA